MEEQLNPTTEAQSSQRKILCAERFQEGIIKMDINHLTGQIIGAAIEVHKAFGPGLLESSYEECLCHEFGLRQMHYRRQ